MSDKYDDSDKGGHSYAEKLALVSKGLMDPKEIGMVSADDAIYEITGLKKPPTEPWLGDWITFEASVVPLEVRSKWARQELKVIPTNPQQWEAEWRQEHKNEFQVQTVLRSGNVQARLDQIFTDPILGFAELLRRSSDLLLVRYEQIKKENPRQPIKTRSDLEAEKRAALSAGSSME
jgi:hypothetical protein